MAKNKSKKKILVTGGGGFIGSHLINDLVSRGHDVSCLDRSERNLPQGIRNTKGDILDQKVVAKAMKGIDVVYHLAGVLGTSELQDVAVDATQVNVIGALNVYNEAAKNGSGVVLISKPNPWLNTYSITKETSERFLQMYRRDYGIKTWVLKWFSVYGPGQKWYGVQKAVPTFIVAALQNKPIPIYGDGTQTADFIFTGDTTKATIDFAENPKAEGKVAEVGTGHGTSVNRLAKTILKLTNSKSKIKYIPMRRGEDNHAKVVADLTVLKKYTDFGDTVKLSDGLIPTVEYYQKVVASM